MTMANRISFLVLSISFAYGGCGRATTTAPSTAVDADNNAPPKLVDSPGAIDETAGGFSYEPPAGWDTVAFPGLKYKVTHGPAANGFAPNINVVDEIYSGSLSDYADLNMANLKRLMPDLKIIRRDEITTNDRQPGKRVVVEDRQVRMELRQTFYIFGNGSRKYVVTCSALADGGEKLDSLFEHCVKTFRMH
jgi:hypothetical protein